MRLGARLGVGMLRNLFFICLVILFAVALDRLFPKDPDSSNSYTIPSFVIIGIWLLYLLLIIFRIIKPPIFVSVLGLIVTFVILYFVFPWENHHTGLKIIKDYYKKKDSVSNVNLEWQYSLPEKIENYPLIALSEKKFSRLGVKKYYTVELYKEKNGLKEVVEGFIIYFKDDNPSSTSEKYIFTLDPKTNTYVLNKEIKEGIILTLNIKNGEFDLDNLGFRKEFFYDNEIYRKTINDIHIVISKINKINENRIMEKYLIYKLLP